MALFAPRFSAAQGSQRRLLSLAKSGISRGVTRPFARRNTEENGAKPNPHGGHYRFAIGKDRRKKGGCYGYDAGKKIGGRKRFALVDTQGLLLVLLVLPADTPERQGAKNLLTLAREKYATLKHIWADAGYNGEEFIGWCKEMLELSMEIVSKPFGVKTFTLLPRRWVVERTFGWMGRYRQLARDYEVNPLHSKGWILISMISLMTKRLSPD